MTGIRSTATARHHPPPPAAAARRRPPRLHTHHRHTHTDMMGLHIWLEHGFEKIVKIAVEVMFQKRTNFTLYKDEK